MSDIYERLIDNNYSSTSASVRVKMPRFCGPKLSNCCFVLSIWGIIMLVLLGVFFRVRSVALTEDVPEVSSKGYNSVATNCFIAAGLYGVTLVISGYQKYAISRGYARL